MPAGFSIRSASRGFTWRCAPGCWPLRPRSIRFAPTTLRPRRCESTQALIDESDVRRELYPVRNVHQSFEHGLLAGLTYSGLSLFTGGWWIKDPMPAHAGYQRIVKLADYYRGIAPESRCAGESGEDRSPADVRPPHERALLRHEARRRSAVASDRSRYRHLPDEAVVKSTEIRAFVFAPPMSMRWLTMGRARSVCRSTRRTASTARPATSWIRIRSSTGSRPKGAGGRTMRECSASLPWPSRTVSDWFPSVLSAAPAAAASEQSESSRSERGWGPASTE